MAESGQNINDLYTPILHYDTTIVHAYYFVVCVEF